MDITKYAILKKLAGGGGGSGDHTVEDAIISRTITDYTNDRVTSIGQSAFRNCNALITVDFSQATIIKDYGFDQCAALTRAKFLNVTSISTSAFGRCAKLTTADFSHLTSMSSYVFTYCSALSALILRGNTVCGLGHVNSLDSTPIKSGTGYIYVPSALVDSYKTATNWTTYANQFRALESYTVDGTTTGELDPTKVNA